MSSHSNRRDFLKATTAAGVGYWVAGRAAAQESNSPNERIRFACIGLGGKGASDLKDAGDAGDIVAMCDVDENTLNKASKRKEYSNAKKYTDFRKLFDEMGSNIDAVTVSTPDHTHTAISVMAMKLGKACFTQKPLTHSIFEARRMADVAREMKVVTQMGNQGTAERILREQAAMVKAGILGNVKEIHVWTNRPIWPQGEGRPADKEPPKYLDWDSWLGPAPVRPYADGYHPFAWRGYWDFGTGALGDMGCHTMNMPYMALDLKNPTAVEAKTSGHNKETYPAWSIVKYEFPATDKRPGLTMTWYDGKQLPDAGLFDGEKVSESGSLLIGDKGKLYAPGDYGEHWKLLGGLEKKEVEFTASPGHFVEFVEAIKGGPAPVSNFPGYSGPLTEVVLLGNLAVWSGGRVEWDAVNMKATNAPELDAIIRPTYRAGYSM